MLSAIVRAGVLKRLDDILNDFPDEVEEASEEAAKAVVDRAEARASRLGGVHAHVAPGIDVSDSEVTLDAVGFPPIMGAEFGGGARPTTRQFPSFTREGYMVYPEINSDEVLEAYEEALEDLDD